VPQIAFTPRAIAGIARCRRFLEGKDGRAAALASATIDRRLAGLSALPESGRPFAADPRLRELVIEFGSSGYLVLYRHEPDRDRVLLLAFRHQREADD
jgi:plasmid stabilization system protein ParE